MAYQTLLQETRDAVSYLTLNRPEVLNAFNDVMGRELLEALRAAERDAGVRCVVLTGAGRAFCAGEDLGPLKQAYAQGRTAAMAATLRQRYHPLIRQVRELPKPVIAMVNGAAAGAGFALGLACDLRLMSDKARFVEAFINIGLVPDSGSGYLLPRMVGLAKALEICLLSEPIDAARALALGLATKVVPPEQLAMVTHELATRLAQGPTLGYGYTKRLLNAALAADWSTALEWEAMLQELASQAADHREGVLAFSEKRAPRFKGA